MLTTYTKKSWEKRDSRQNSIYLEKKYYSIHENVIPLIWLTTAILILNINVIFSKNLVQPGLI